MGATGLDIPVWNRGFWRNSAESRVDPDLGSPEMKWNICVISVNRFIQTTGKRFHNNMTVQKNIPNFKPSGVSKYWQMLMVEGCFVENREDDAAKPSKTTENRT